MNELAELIEAFRSESDEILDRVEELLLRLEQSPDDDELLHEIFRGAHTIKGNAACLSFDDLTAFAHVVEEVLEKLRSGTAEPDGGTISRLLESVDAMRDLARRAVEGNGALTQQQRDLMDRLRVVWASGLPLGGGRQRQAGGPHYTGSLRVSTAKLDRMLDLTGEIAIARGRVREMAGGDEQLLDAVRAVDALCFDLQELVMSARMVVLGPALRPFQRVVRDVAESLRKRVALVIEAGDVEVDSTVIEQLRDPIAHMLRNAIDHGIESPEERVACGKDAVGTVRITASHDRSGITIRFSDDGNGLDDELIARRAQELGLEPHHNLIFEPGFSTAGAVTDVSGRGVGMDVVRRNVEALRGTISVASRRGAGTTITIRLPLTVSVIEGFAVSAAGETYVLPIDTVSECMALPLSAAGDAVGILNVRGEALPFLRLRELFGLGNALSPRENVVVVQHDQGRAGIVVDELLGASDTVMKPMGGLLRQVSGVAGTSILGNGRVALVLDAREIVRCAINSQSATQ
ncbi:MAG TPA: chemotaxis protein CheA [Thermoanaerobaculia bacterium]|nr:chemotaxis protein CheA [Thermoanaerobaculia bacterium]